MGVRVELKPLLFETDVGEAPFKLDMIAEAEVEAELDFEVIEPETEVEFSEGTDVIEGSIVEVTPLVVVCAAFSDRTVEVSDTAVEGIVGPSRP